MVNLGGSDLTSRVPNDLAPRVELQPCCTLPHVTVPPVTPPAHRGRVGVLYVPHQAHQNLSVPSGASSMSPLPQLVQVSSRRTASLIASTSAATSRSNSPIVSPLLLAGESLSPYGNTRPSQPDAAPAHAPSNTTRRPDQPQRPASSRSAVLSRADSRRDRSTAAVSQFRA